MSAKALVEVTKKEFYAALFADARDIMPTLEGNYPYSATWQTKDNHRTLFGKSQDSELGTTIYFLLK